MRTKTGKWWRGLGVVGVIVLGNAGSLRAAPVEIHVATHGHDNATGAGPENALATIQAALTKARTLKPATIYLHGGVYRLAEPLVLLPEDSGASASAPLTITAYANEVPVLSGGIPLRNWQQVSPNLWQADARGQLGSNCFFRSLFINGKRGVRARTPNEGEFYKMEGARSNDKPFQFKFREGDIKEGWAAGGVEVVACEKWTVIRQFIRHVDNAARLVTLSGTGADHTRESGARYFIENAPEAIDIAGEWRLDRSNGVVTALFAPGADPNRMEIIVPRLQELVQFKGDFGTSRAVRNIIVRGLTFSETDWALPDEGYRDSQAAVSIRGDVYGDGMVDCVIERCTFTRMAGYAIDLGRGCRRNRILRNQVFDVGAGGIRVGETSVRTPSFEATHSTEITDNHLHHMGRLYPPAVGVFIIQSATNRVAHNHIHDLYYTGVSVGWTWGYRDSPCHDNVIEFNHMHDIGMGLLSDMGAVYTLGPQPGTVVRHNLIHDVTSFTYGGWGLYTDEGSAGIVLENNVVYRCKSAGFHQHYGKENVIRNNIFAFNRESQLMRSREETHLSFWCTNNVIVFDSGTLLASTWKNDQFVLDRNVYWDTRLAEDPTKLKLSGVPWEQWRARGHDTNSIIADPLFVDPSRNDYRLQPNSPAFKLGFKPIDLTKVGIRD